MSEFENPIEKSTNNNEGGQENAVEEKLKITIEDLKTRVNGYSPEKLEFVVNNLGFTIEGDGYKGLIEIIEGSTNMSEVETLAAMIRTAEEEFEKKEEK